MPSSEPRAVYVFSHTHWDREWYRSFEGFRYRLGQAMEQILQQLESGALETFLLDGQTILLEDYLALFPQQSERIAALVRADRLFIGPWYILPDEFLISGEALIRNLLIGTAQARRLGATTFYGYLPDMFGHIAQMPQILKRSGLEPALVWRGVNPRQTIFDWVAPDGSGVETVHLTKGYYQDRFIAADPVGLEPILDGLAAAAPVGWPLLLPNGGDHLAPPPDFQHQLQRFNASQERYCLQESSLAQYLDALPPRAKESIYGELRDPSAAYILPGTLSARVYLKQRNDQLQYQLEKLVEPFLTWNWLQGGPYPATFLALAWKYLLQNQPHDSICGCSIDEVHQDMEPRFRACATLINELLDTASQQMLGWKPGQPPGPALILFNLSAVPFEGILPLTLMTAKAMPTLSLQEAGGQPVELEILGHGPSERFNSEIDVLPHWESLYTYQCLGRFSLAPMSLALYPLSAQGRPTLPQPASLGGATLSNSRLKIDIGSEGGLRFYQKTGNKWQLLMTGHIFLDSGDAGDEYNYSPPATNRCYLAQLDGWAIDSHALAQKLHLTYRLRLPVALSPERQNRGEEMVDCALETEILLYADSSRIEFTTRLNNQARDHRLQLLWLPALAPVQCEAGTAFGSVERPVSFNPNWDMPVSQEHQGETFPFLDWIYLRSPENSSLLLTEGLHEGAWVPWEDKHALAITLLRSVGWLSRDDLRTRGGGAGPRMPTPEAQCQGPHTFRYALAFPGSSREQALRAYAQWPARVLSWQARALPQLRSLFAVEPPSVLVSALKKCDEEEAVLLRCVNMNPSATDLKVQALFPCRGIEAADLLEQTVTEARLQCFEDRASIHLQPFEIVSFKFYPVLADN